MTRSQYIYYAMPLFVLLSCGALMNALLGSLGALALAGVLMALAWGVVWMRLYYQRSASLRPEFSVLSVLPLAVYFVGTYTQTPLFAQSDFWNALYTVSWIAFCVIMIAAARPDGGISIKKDPVFCLIAPLTIMYALWTWGSYSLALQNIS